MKSHARIENGQVVEVIDPMFYEIDSPEGSEYTFKKGDEVSVERRFTPEVAASLVDIGSATVNVGDSYKDGVFALYVAPAPSAASILARNTATRDTLLSVATGRIAPLQDAVDLGEATTAETTALTSWKQYRVAVNRVDLIAQDAQWPAVPA